MIMGCKICDVYTTCNLGHSSTKFELCILNVRGKWPPCEYSQWLCFAIFQVNIIFIKYIVLFILSTAEGGDLCKSCKS